MEYIGNIKDYCHKSLDNDYNYYYFLNSDLYSYKHHIQQINDLIQKWRDRLDKIDKGLYIKGNYLFFTINGARYYVSLSSFTSEWDNIKDIISDFSLLAENVAYLFGELD